MAKQISVKKTTKKRTKNKVATCDDVVTYKESGVAYIMNLAVSVYVYFVAFMLVVYMISSLVAGVISLVEGFMNLATSSAGLFSTPDRIELELSLLHTIAFTIVLVKAYKILIAFADTKHINLKLLVEISIIAPTIELIFNPTAYEFDMKALFAVYALLNLVAYLYFYKTIKKVNDDYIRENSCK